MKLLLYVKVEWEVQKQQVYWKNKDSKVFIIDVRESGEVAGGKIPSANNIPLSKLALRKGELDKEKSYVVVCQSGHRSKAACGFLVEW